VTAVEEECASDLGVEGRRLLSVVAREASRMGELIDDLLLAEHDARTLAARLAETKHERRHTGRRTGKTATAP
jgi:hypothetical protein